MSPTEHPHVGTIEPSNTMPPGPAASEDAGPLLDAQCCPEPSPTCQECEYVRGLGAVSVPERVRGVVCERVEARDDDMHM
jgi:hypothetical protein